MSKNKELKRRFNILMEVYKLDHYLGNLLNEFNESNSSRSQALCQMTDEYMKEFVSQVLEIDDYIKYFGDVRNNGSFFVDDIFSLIYDTSYEEKPSCMKIVRKLEGLKLAFDTRVK